MAVWFGSPSDEQPDSGVICTGNDCAPGDEYSCENCRRWDVWDGNVSGHSESADVYAPHKDVSKSEDSALEFAKGTSWATPIVTAVVSDRVASIRSAGETVTTSEMKAMLTESAEPVGNNGEKLLRASELDSVICQEKGLTMPKGDTSPVRE